MEKEIAFSGILSSNPEQNPGTFLLEKSHTSSISLAIFKLIAILSMVLKGVFLVSNYQIFSTGTE